MSTTPVMLRRRRNCTVYVRSVTIHTPSDVHSIRRDMHENVILIVRAVQRPRGNAELLRSTFDELFAASREAGAEIARLGEERIIVTPPGVGIWQP